MLRVISHTTGLRLSLVARVTNDEWTCCAVNDQLEFGLELGGTLPVETTLCAEVRDARKAVLISHASEDPRYCGHPTPQLYKFESYISVPIFLPDGTYFGNVCALDARPVDLSQPQTLEMFQVFAEMIGTQLEAEAQSEDTTRQLLEATRTAELREQFIAILGHDMRTPLQAITMGAEVLARRQLADADLKVVERIARSTVRMKRLIDDVLDFAHGRIGNGIPLQTGPIPDVAAMFLQVVDELRAIHPTRTIGFVVEGGGGMEADAGRLGRVLQNLLSNALTHSPPDAEVDVGLRIEPARVVLSVANGGPALAPDFVTRMFEPFYRGPSQGGLGLGLYIAARITQAHGGTIAATSDVTATTVTCTLPR